MYGSRVVPYIWYARKGNSKQIAPILPKTASRGSACLKQTGIRRLTNIQRYSSARARTSLFSDTEQKRRLAATPHNERFALNSSVILSRSNRSRIATTITICKVMRLFHEKLKASPSFPNTPRIIFRTSGNTKAESAHSTTNAIKIYVSFLFVILVLDSGYSKAANITAL